MLRIPRAIECGTQTNKAELHRISLSLKEYKDMTQTTVGELGCCFHQEMYTFPAERFLPWRPTAMAWHIACKHRAKKCNPQGGGMQLSIQCLISKIPASRVLVTLITHPYMSEHIHRTCPSCTIWQSFSIIICSHIYSRLCCNPL